MAENENAVNDETLNNASQSTQDTSSEMLKPWMKTLGKDFYQNKELGKYDSLKDAVNALLSRPERKTLPESYGYGDADELFRKAGATKDEADAIEKYYMSKMPARKERKEIFGDNFDTEDRYYSKAVEQLIEDKDSIVRDGLDKNPAFVKAMARAGRELGQASFNPTARESSPRRNPYREIIEQFTK